MDRDTFLYLCFYGSMDRLWRMLLRKNEQIFHSLVFAFNKTNLVSLNHSYQYGAQKMDIRCSRETEKPKNDGKRVYAYACIYIYRRPGILPGTCPYSAIGVFP